MGLTADMMENLRGVYLPPLRDASQGLKPSRTSQLARLLQVGRRDRYRLHQQGAAGTRWQTEGAANLVTNG